MKYKFCRLALLAALGCRAAPDTDDSSPTDDTGDTDTDDTEDSGETGDTEPDPFPDCAAVTGTAAVTFTHDDGATLAPTDGVLSGTSYTFGLAVDPGDPNELAAAHGAWLLRSHDGGCTWSQAGLLPGSTMRLEAAGGGRFYAWADNAAELARIEGETITPLSSPIGSVVGLGVDRADRDHLRIAGWDGGLSESTDGGETWSKLGTSPLGGSGWLYRVAFGPADLDHVVAGAGVEGAFVSTDGGETWARSTGFGEGSVNVFNLQLSPAAPEVAWAAGLNLAESDAGAPTGGRHIWRSGDGGLTWGAAVDHGEAVGSTTVTLVNGPVMYAHPTDAARLYFVFGTYFQAYGTDLFRYDAGGDLLTVTHSDHDDIGAIVASPADPDLLYVGLVTEEIF